MDSLKFIEKFPYQMMLVVILFFGWVTIFMVVNQVVKTKKLPQKIELDIKKRIVSTIHGLLTLILAASQFFPLTSFDLPNTPLQVVTVLISLSYFAYDTALLQYYGILSTDVLLHHLFSFLAEGIMIFSGYGGIGAMGTLLMSEVSNFPMHLRSILKHYDLRYTKSYQLCQVLYFTLYMFARGIFNPFFILYPCLVSVNTPRVGTFAIVVLTVQSYHFMWKMVQIMKNKISQYQEMQSKSIKYFWLTENLQVQKLSFYHQAMGRKFFDFFMIKIFIIFFNKSLICYVKIYYSFYLYIKFKLIFLKSSYKA